MKRFFFLSFLGFVIACKKDAPIPTDNEPGVAQKIKKVWVANQVTEGGTVVFSKSGTNNLKAGYSQFKLDLANTSAASLTEFDGNSFKGQYELNNDKTLILKNLSPLPTGNIGSIEFTITEVSGSILKLSRVTTSAKTGGQAVSYILE